MFIFHLIICISTSTISISNSFICSFSKQKHNDLFNLVSKQHPIYFEPTNWLFNTVIALLYIIIHLKSNAFEKNVFIKSVLEM